MRLDKNDPLRFAKKRVFGLDRQALKSAGAWGKGEASPGAKSPLHRHEVGGGGRESASGLEQNHRSTDVKSAGAALETEDKTSPLLYPSTRVW